MTGAEQSARALGYFSLGLGAAQILAPRPLAALVGIEYGNKARVVMRLVGAREIAAGVGILTQRRPGRWLWARVAGDLMDLAALGAALTSDNNQRGRLAATLTAVAGITAADLQSAEWLTDDSDCVDGLRVRQAITINRSPAEVYGFWRDFINFPVFMRHVVSVEMQSDRLSHWVVQGPAGQQVAWDAEITDDRPGEAIAWRSLPGGALENSGSVRFTPAAGGRGTEVRLDLRYAPPAGVLGAALARMFGEEPRIQVPADLRRLKQVIETGEVVRSDAVVDHARLPQRAAQPPLEVPA